MTNPGIDGIGKKAVGKHAIYKIYDRFQAAMYRDGKPIMKRRAQGDLPGTLDFYQFVFSKGKTLIPKNKGHFCNRKRQPCIEAGV